MELPYKGSYSGGSPYQDDDPAGEPAVLPPRDEAELRKLVVRYRERYERLSREYAALARSKEDLERLLESIMTSHSWRLTAPLRAAVSFLRNGSGALFPLVRRAVHPIELKPGRNITRKDEGFEIDGPSPYLNAETPHRPMGWLLLRGVLTSEKSHQFFFFHYPAGDVCTERERSLVPLVAGTETAVLIRVPARATVFRLEPFDTSGTFALNDLKLQELGALQVAAYFARKHFGPIASNPRAMATKLRKAWAVFREAGFTGLKLRLLANQVTLDYQEWVRRFDTLTSQECERIAEHLATLERKPLISVLLPVYNTPERWLRAAIESVRAQIYQNWELCIADDASSEPHVRRVLEEYAAADPRIKLTFRETNGHIAEASASALALATGEYTALLDHDDELTAHALAHVVCALNERPGLKFLYSDEDKITSYGMRFNPHFKPQWNPDLLLSQNYLCHLCVFSTDVLRAAGGFRSGFDGAQDWDLALRVTERLDPSEIAHLPHVLYHWRVVEGSTAQATGNKPYVLEAQKRAVTEHLERRGIKGAKVRIDEAISHLHVTFPVPDPAPLVSIIIPTRDCRALLERCVTSIRERSTYGNYEIIIVDNRSERPETVEYFRSLEGADGISVIRDELPFNFSRINNSAVRHARGELLAFLNNDLEVISARWLDEMVAHAVRPEVGAVGARLLFPNGMVQHAGVILGIGGVAGHAHKGRLRHDPGYFNRAILTQNLSAVTAACAVMRRAVFEEAGGFDEAGLAVAFNDIDLCLRIRERGYRIVYAPAAELYHHESASRGYEVTPEKVKRFERETEEMKRRWAHVLRNDPYYNPNLTLLSEDFALAFPPRVNRPWPA